MSTSSCNTRVHGILLLLLLLLLPVVSSSSTSITSSCLIILPIRLRVPIGAKKLNPKIALYFRERGTNADAAGWAYPWNCWA